MLFARLGLGCKQPYLFQPNIIKVIKCLEIHANFMPTWLQPRCICCESLLRTVQELQGNMMAGGMLSQSLKGFSWGGLCPVSAIQFSVGQKHCKEGLVASWVPLCLSVACLSQWLGYPGIWDHLKVQVCCSAKQQRLWCCFRGQDGRCFTVPLASMFPCPRFAQ